MLLAVELFGRLIDLLGFDSNPLQFPVDLADERVFVLFLLRIEILLLGIEVNDVNFPVDLLLELEYHIQVEIPVEV